ncbi:MAG TPA: DUF2225 domain-containing protein [Acidobacteriota bacterium]|nr:DUF2225 domain-containing protein [Acidobacteriota bacterium]
MPKDSPFLLFKVECPICKTINEFEMIRVGAYAEDGRDTDFCPLRIKWRFPRYQAYNPLVFFTATCSNCFYTREFTNSFKDWKNDNNFRFYRLKQVKEKHLEQLSTAGSVVKMLGEAIDVPRNPNESAILKLHLAVYDERLADHHSKLDLGRLYLRIGWVFRDLQEGDNPQQVYLRALLYETDNKYGMLSQTVDSVQAELESLAQQVKSHQESEEVTTEVKSQMLAFEDRYQERVTALNTCLDDTRRQLTSMGELIEEYSQALLGGGGQTDGRAFGACASFQEFLKQAKRSWPGIVADEREAIEKAVDNYKAAFVGGRDILPGTQQIQASYMIAELSHRIGRYEEAKEYFTSTIKAGQEFIYRNRNDQSRTILARKILELAIEQGRSNLAALKGA